MAIIVSTLAPIWFPHCPAWMCTISLILAVVWNSLNHLVCLVNVFGLFETSEWVPYNSRARRNN